MGTVCIVLAVIGVAVKTPKSQRKQEPLVHDESYMSTEAYYNDPSSRTRDVPSYIQQAYGEQDSAQKYDVSRLPELQGTTGSLLYSYIEDVPSPYQLLTRDQQESHVYKTCAVNNAKGGMISKSDEKSHDYAECGPTSELYMTMSG